MAYDFSNLNDKDLEELTRDILSEKLGLDFQSFKNGRDQGIDLRHATVKNENKIIVQVKHYLESGFTKLKSTLKKKEIQNITRINPERYIFVTSIGLTPQNKEEIKLILRPHIHQTGDILDKKSLNNFLRNNPSFIDRHFKLWFSDTAVLQRIIKNGIKGRSEFMESKIRAGIKLFVPSRNHNFAVDVLNKNNFLLITGAPGIGKTTLANFLTYQFIAKGFELAYVREIREAEDAYIPGKNQVFYFDDFLGAITLDLRSSRNADSAIANFVERVKADKQKKLILTCRTTILNQAKQESETIHNSKLELSKYEVSIENYRDLDKAKILYNHIYFSNLSEGLKSVFFKGQFYWKVIKHINYNPRIVQFFTDIDRLQPGVEYEKEVIEFLDDPSKIWQKSFENQISPEARLFLTTLYSLGSSHVVDETTLKIAFETRMDHEVKNNNYTKHPNVFRKVVDELLGGFIQRIQKIDKNYNTIEYKFLNPSIEDFMHLHFSSNVREYILALHSAISFDQFKDRITTSKSLKAKCILVDEAHSSELKQTFITRLPYLEVGYDSKELKTVVILIRHFSWEGIQAQVIEIMNTFTPLVLTWDDRDDLIEILDFVAQHNLINEFKLDLHDIILTLSENINYYFHIKDLSKLINKNKLYASLIESAKFEDPDFYEKFQTNINSSWSRSLTYYIDQIPHLNTITNSKELAEVVENRKAEARQITESLKLSPSECIDSYTFDYHAQLKKSISITANKSINISNVQDDSGEENEVLEIDRLFDSEANYYRTDDESPALF